MVKSVEVGAKLGPFDLVERLGTGGAGAVFKARDTNSGNEFALKTLTPSATVNEEIHKRFIREISVAQKLNHPNIVEYGECGLDEEVLFYTMELIPWGTLGDVLARRNFLPWRDAAECAVHICEGLQYLHNSKIIHRDLKPANIFLASDGRLKLGDFGLARDLDSTRLTIDGQTVGTAKYLAPEQARAGEIDGRTDLYAVGCILFEMLTGRPPFLQDDPYAPHSYMFLMQQHVEDPPPRVTEFCASCPESLDDLVDRLLAKSPDDRPATAELVIEHLQGILDDPAAKLPEPVKNQKQDAEVTVPKSLTERLHADATAERAFNPKALLVIAALILLAIVAAVIASR